MAFTAAIREVISALSWGGGVGRHGGFVVEKWDDVERVRPGRRARAAQRPDGGGAHGRDLVLEQGRDVADERGCLAGEQSVAAPG